MSEAWERGEHPAQAETHEPLTEFDGPIGRGADEPNVCNECGELISPDRSPGVWLHDAGALGDLAYDLNEDHAAIPEKEA